MLFFCGEEKIVSLATNYIEDKSPGPINHRQIRMNIPKVSQNSPSKRETLNQCWFNVGPSSTTLGQHQIKIGSASPVCWIPVQRLRRWPAFTQCWHLPSRPTISPSVSLVFESLWELGTFLNAGSLPIRVNNLMSISVLFWAPIIRLFMLFSYRSTSVGGSLVKCPCGCLILIVNPLMSCVDCRPMVLRLADDSALSLR